jgi:hypothetical protein
MDLKEFVSETLVQIVAGVKQAQLETKVLGAEVNPHLVGGSQSDAVKLGYLRAGGNGFAQIVNFDVALTIMEGTGTKGGI